MGRLWLGRAVMKSSLLDKFCLAASFEFPSMVTASFVLTTKTGVAVPLVPVTLLDCANVPQVLQKKRMQNLKTNQFLWDN